MLSFPLMLRIRLYPTLLAFFLRIDKLSIVELNRVIKSELGDINFHLQEKKSASDVTVTSTPNRSIKQLM